VFAAVFNLMRRDLLTGLLDGSPPNTDLESQKELLREVQKMAINKGWCLSTAAFPTIFTHVKPWRCNKLRQRVLMWMAD
jgi:hypothetical protein